MKNYKKNTMTTLPRADPCDRKTCYRNCGIKLPELFLKAHHLSAVAISLIQIVKQYLLTEDFAGNVGMKYVVEMISVLIVGQNNKWNKSSYDNDSIDSWAGYISELQDDTKYLWWNIFGI